MSYSCKKGTHLCKIFCYYSSIDASHSDGLGRLVNDEYSKKANCKMKKIICEGVPKLWLCAIKDIKSGQQLTYDYGVNNLPWRKLKVSIYFVLHCVLPQTSEKC